jgi:hypothetical protein
MTGMAGASGGLRGRRGSLSVRFFAACVVLAACPAAAKPGFVFGEALAFGAHWPADAVGLRIVYQADTLSLERDPRGRWVTARGRFPVDTAKFAPALEALFALHTREPLGPLAKAEPTVAERFGPTEARTVEVRFASGKTGRIMLAGSVPGDYSSTYWMARKGGVVHRVAGNASWGFAVQEAAWWEHRLLPAFSPFDVSAVEADWADSAGTRHHYRLVKTGRMTAALDGPEPVDVHFDYAGEVFTQATVLILDSVPDASSPAASAQALTPAALDLRISLEDGSTFALAFGPERNGSRSLRHPREDRIVTIESWRLRPFLVTRAKLTQGPVHGPWQDDGTDYDYSDYDYPGRGVLLPNFHHRGEEGDGDGHAE